MTPTHPAVSQARPLGAQSLAKYWPLSLCHEPKLRLMLEPRTRPQWVVWMQPPCPAEDESYAWACKLCQLLPVPGSKPWRILFNSIDIALDSLQPTLCILPLH